MNISYLGQNNLPRGIRNNNPGNIEQNASNNWRGKVPPSQNTDGRFEQFERMVFGVRAMIKLLRDSYIKRSEFDTIELIVTKYAPSFENDTRAYINAVSRDTGFARNQRLGTDKATIRKLVQAMAKHETGWARAVSDEMFDAAWSIA
jgi:hypothetical protein